VILKSYMYYGTGHLHIIQYFVLKYIKCNIVKRDKRKVQCVAEKLKQSVSMSVLSSIINDLVLA
jgi:hypothetical protein